MVLGRDERGYLDEVDGLLADGVGQLGNATGVLLPLAGAGSRHRARLLFALAHDRARPHPMASGGAAVELLHLGTLVHDDIVDGAAERRHHPAAHHALGVPVALWAADALFARAVSLAGSVGPPAADAACTALERVAASQILEAAQPPAAAYWEVVDGKTGALFVAVAEIADVLVGGTLGPDVATSAAAFGRLFQYVDDLHDLTAQPGDLGKPVGQDAKNRLETLPALDLARSPGAVAQRIAGLRHDVLDPLGDDPARPRLEAAVHQVLRTLPELAP